VPETPIAWGEPHTTEGGVDGWISRALGMAVSEQVRAQLFSTDVEIAKQAARLDGLGHALYLVPDVTERLLRALDAEGPHPRDGGGRGGRPSSTVPSARSTRPRPAAQRTRPHRTAPQKRHRQGNAP
jgi:hypothetical protein